MIDAKKALVYADNFHNNRTERFKPLKHHIMGVLGSEIKCASETGEYSYVFEKSILTNGFPTYVSDVDVRYVLTLISLEHGYRLSDRDAFLSPNTYEFSWNYAPSSLSP